jgi:hypothetical protein
VGAIPGAAGSGAGFVGFGGLDPNNAPYASIIHDGFAGLIRSDKTGTANYSPLNFMTGGVVRYAIDATGAHTFSGPISTNSNLTLNGNSIELGPTAAGPAYIDFHSSGTGNDFDTRLISSGGSSGAGNGTLDIYAGSINFRSSQGVAPIFFNASGYAPHMRSNSSNSSFEWINGANSAANMTLSDAGYLTVRNGISWSQPSSGVGSLTMSNELVMANSNLIRFNATNGYTATIRADTSNMVGFINMAGNAWNTQLYDDGSFWIRNQWQWGDRSNTSGQYNGTGSTGGHTERNAIVQQSDNVNMYLSHTGGGGTLEWFGCAGNNVGAIGCNTTSTSYATTSDYRLKTDVEDLTGGLDRVMLMRPVTFTWIASGQPDRGFIAHELQPVEPSAVTGEKDEMMLDPMNPDAGEVPKYQAVDLSFCIPDMVAALQEMKQQLDVALARIATLEAAR